MQAEFASVKVIKETNQFSYIAAVFYNFEDKIPKFNSTKFCMNNLWSIMQSKWKLILYSGADSSVRSF